ncbi:MAG: hypothetical protein D6725_03220 [Planctomycetota bacterium]|nr:MAG: hypothetical protein D6725_03220 [Planctomycetota bacterium]
MLRVFGQAVMRRRRRGALRGRSLLVPGLVIVVLLVLFGGRFGWGPPGEGTSGTERGESRRTQRVSAAGRDSVGQAAGQQPQAGESDAGTPDVVDVVDVLVEDRKYKVLDARGAWRPASLDEVVQRAARARGDADGVRVRIRRAESARVRAWMRLHEELLKAGLREEAIRLTDVNGRP